MIKSPTREAILGFDALIVVYSPKLNHEGNGGTHSLYQFMQEIGSFMSINKELVLYISSDFLNLYTPQISIRERCKSIADSDFPDFFAKVLTSIKKKKLKNICVLQWGADHIFKCRGVSFVSFVWETPAAPS